MPALSSDVISRFIGQKVKDIYGRDFGMILNVYTEIDGSVIGIEASISNEVHTLDPYRLRVEDDKLFILPEWKAEASRVLGLMDKARRRQRAIEELYNKGDVSKSMYDDMKRKVDSEVLKLKDDYVKLKNKLKNKLNEIDDLLLHVDKAMAMLKMNYISNEIPENAYKTSIEYLRQVKESSSLEKDDIRKTLDRMDSLDKESMDAKPLGSQISQEDRRKEETQLQPPIPVKVINSV